MAVRALSEFRQVRDPVRGVLSQRSKVLEPKVRSLGHVVNTSLYHSTASMAGLRSQVPYLGSRTFGILINIKMQQCPNRAATIRERWFGVRNYGYEKMVISNEEPRRPSLRGACDEAIHLESWAKLY